MLMRVERRAACRIVFLLCQQFFELDILLTIACFPRRRLVEYRPIRHIGREFCSSGRACLPSRFNLLERLNCRDVIPKFCFAPSPKCSSVMRKFCALSCSFSLCRVSCPVRSMTTLCSFVSSCGCCGSGYSVIPPSVRNSQVPQASLLSVCKSSSSFRMFSASICSKISAVPS